MKNFRDGTTYLVVKPHRYGQLRVVKATSRRPTSVDADCVVIKVQLRVPDAAFLPLQPEAVVTVPETLVQQPVEGEAVEPA